ncbi:hypothetical protein GPALN_010123 [Globodera pallida]|nr:hypothetical protein GPALN_010123 [Globodera pallida]
MACVKFCSRWQNVRDKASKLVQLTVVIETFRRWIYLSSPITLDEQQIVNYWIELFAVRTANIDDHWWKWSPFEMDVFREIGNLFVDAKEVFALTFDKIECFGGIKELLNNICENIKDFSQPYTVFRTTQPFIEQWRSSNCIYGKFRYVFPPRHRTSDNLSSMKCVICMTGKPSVLRYTAKIGCLSSDGPITIGVATYSQLRGSWTPEYRDGIFRVWGTPGYVDISTYIAISRCGHDNPTVHVRITNLDNPNEWMEEMLKIELLARKSAVVLGFNIAPSARKIFYFHQFPPILRFFQRRLVNCELEIVCLNMDADGTPHYYLIGSGVQFNEQNGIIIPIYETERLAFCSQDKITLVIHRDEHEKNNCIIIKQSIWCKQFNHRTNRIFYNGHTHSIWCKQFNHRAPRIFYNGHTHSIWCKQFNHRTNRIFYNGHTHSIRCKQFNHRAPRIFYNGHTTNTPTFTSNRI